MTNALMLVQAAANGWGVPVAEAFERLLDQAEGKR